MRKQLKSLMVAGTMVLGSLAAIPAPASAQQIHVALGDVPEMETLLFLVGLARAQEKGLDAKVTFFSGEELAIQAILAGQADIGVGSPYAVIQNADVPVRMFYQISRIIFFPVASKEIKDWKDMEGVSMAFHSRGGPLEPLAMMKAEREGITLGEPQFVSGSENRVVALMQGHIKAALIDLLNTNMILKEAPDKFHVLPWVDEVVTDEAMFAQEEWLKNNQDAVKLLLTETLKVTQEICKDPQIIADAREKYDLIPDMPPELVEQIASYYKEAIEAGVYSCTGGSPAFAETDIGVFSAAGQLKGDDLTPEKFWNFDTLQAVQKELGIDPAKSGG
jgi:NitT/TauT family transport system substrate-binding protein